LRRFGYLIASLSRAQLASSTSSFFEYNASKCAFEAPEIVSLECSKDEIKQNEVKVSFFIN
jgi:hypothetical protein